MRRPPQMTVDDARKVLAKMTATWRMREPLTQPEIGEWLDTLRPFAYRAAMEAVVDLRETAQWMPSHNEFISAAQAAARRIARETPSLPETTGPAVDNATALARVRSLRRQLHEHE